MGRGGRQVREQCRADCGRLEKGGKGRGHRSDPALARANGIPALLKATAASLGLHKAMMQPEATTESMGRCPYPGSFLITVLAVRVQVPQVPAVGNPYTPTPQPSQVQLGGTLGPGALTYPWAMGCQQCSAAVSLQPEDPGRLGKGWKR